MSALNTEVVTPEVARELMRKMAEIAATSADSRQCWARMLGAVSGCTELPAQFNTAAFLPRKDAA